MSNPRIEIKSKRKDNNSSPFTEIYVDGHKLNGVRSFELRQGVGNTIPILTVDLNALNISTDLEAVLMQKGFGEIGISFKNNEVNIIEKGLSEESP